MEGWKPSPKAYIPPHKRHSSRASECNRPNAAGRLPRNPTYAEPWGHKPIGFWIIHCECSVRDGNGQTELDRVEAAVDTLLRENLFSSIFSKPIGHTANILCFIRNWDDLGLVFSSGLKLREVIDGFYKCAIYFRINRGKEYSKYLLCVDGDLYQFMDSRYKLLYRKSDSVEILREL